MSLPLITPTRCVLQLGDEALSIYDVGSSRVQCVESVSWGDAEFLKKVSRSIKVDCKSKPVLILNDMTDQHFKGGQRMPKVGGLDKKNVLNRRLHVAFPNFPIRGALPIKPPKGAGKGAPKDTYLFAAVPMSDPVHTTIEAVKMSMSSVSGLCLLPVESADMVNKLATILSKDKPQKPRWCVFIGQHSSGGGLRQVITRDGQLAMTRMTPVSSLADNATKWAEEVAQEFKATLSYLSRFGYAQDDPLLLIVIANPEAAEFLEQKIQIDCDFHAYSVNELAHLMKMKIGAQEEPYYADILHVAWAGRKMSYTLPMAAPDIENISRPRQIAALVAFVMVLGAGYLGWQIYNDLARYVDMGDEYDTRQAQHRKVSKSLDEEQERLASIGFDVDLVQGSMDAFNGLEKNRLRSIPFMAGVGDALGPFIRLDSLKIHSLDKAVTGSDRGGDRSRGQDDQGASVLEAELLISFPPELDVEKSRADVDALVKRLSQALPKHHVRIDSDVGTRAYAATLSGEVGQGVQSAPTEEDEYNATILIEGPVQ